MEIEYLLLKIYGYNDKMSCVSGVSQLMLTEDANLIKNFHGRPANLNAHKALNIKRLANVVVNCFTTFCNLVNYSDVEHGKSFAFNYCAKSLPKFFQSSVLIHSPLLHVDKWYLTTTVPCKRFDATNPAS